MNDLTALQFFAALPLVFFGIVIIGLVAVVIDKLSRRTKGIF
jgi:hypothetical protein